MSFSGQTYSGKIYDLDNFKRADVNIIDIAHGLSNICRFSGQTSKFYSVAQHSVLVSQYIEKHLNGTRESCLFGLLHDASEAYMGDFISTIKYRESMVEYREIEKMLMGKILSVFGLIYKDNPVVKIADEVLLCAEAIQLFRRGEIQERVLESVSFDVDQYDYSLIIDQVDYNVAKIMFLERFDELKLSS